MEARVILEWDDKQWQAALSKSASDRMGVACFVLEKDIINHFGTRQAPGVVTGRLKSSITSNWTGRRTSGHQSNFGDPPIANPGGAWPVIKGVTGTNVFYGAKLEYGEGYSRPYPFLRPALERNRGNIERLFKGL